MTDHDYVIIGGGSSRVRAGRPADRGPRQRGSCCWRRAAPARPPRRCSGGWPQLIGTDADWGGVTTPQAGAGPLPYPRGRGLGGSGAINAMAHVRGHAGDLRRLGSGRGARLGVRRAAAVLPAQRARRRRPRPGAARDRRPGPGRPGARVPRAPGRLRVRPGAVPPWATRRPVTCPAARQEGVAWPDLAIDARAAGQPGRRLPAPGPGPRPNLTVLDRLPGHPPDRPRRPVHRRRVPARRQAGNGARGGGGDRVRGRGRHAAAAACCPASAPPGTCATWASSLSADLPGVGENLQDHPVAMACYSSRRAAARQPLQPRRDLRRRCPARLARGLARPAPVPDPAAGRPARPPCPGHRLRPGRRRDRPRQPRHRPARVRRPGSRPADRPRLPDRGRRPGPAGSRPGHHPPRRRRHRVRPARRQRGHCPAPRARDSDEPAGLDQAARSAATTTPPAPAGSALPPTPARSSTRSCGSTASPGCASPTRPSCRSIPNAHPHATVLAVAEKAAALITGGL